MKKYIAGIITAVCLLFTTPTYAQVAQPRGGEGGIGILMSTPELFGLYGTYFPNNNLSLDLWATLSTVDAGATVFLPFAGTSDTHSVAITGLAGYAHDMVPNLPYHSFHGIVAAGYAWESPGGWDFRAQAGVALAKYAVVDPIGAGFHAHAQIGHVF